MQTAFQYRLALGAAVMFTPFAAADLDSITDVLPEDAVFVGMATNARASMNKLKATSLWSVMENDDVRAQWDTMLQDMAGEMAELFNDEDVTPEMLVPNGPMTLGVFPSVIDNGTSVAPGFLFAGAFGDEAEATFDRIRTVVESDDARDEGVVVEEIEINDRTGLKITPPAVDLDEMEDEFDMGGGMGGMMPFGDPEEMIGDALESFYVLRAGDHVMISSQESALSRAVDVIDGADLGRLSSRSDVQAMIDGIGERDVAGMLLMRDIGTMLAGVDEMGMMQMGAPLLSQFIGDIDGFGYGMTIDGSDAMIEGRAMVYMPNGTAGFTALLDTESGVGQIPEFVPAGAVSYSRLNVEFKGMAPLLNRIMRTAMAFGLGGGGGGDEMQQMQEIIAQFTETLGEQVHMVGTVERPITATSSQSFTAIACPDTRGMDQLLSQFGGGMGMEGRDFVGNRLYTMDMGGMMMMGGMGMPMDGEAPPKQAIGLGGGFAFVGTEPGVEQMLRSLGDAEARSLAQDPRVARVLQQLDGQYIGWGWSDTAEGMIVDMQVAELEQAAMMKSLEELAEQDPEFAAMLREDMAGGAMDALTEVMTPDMIRRTLGDSIWTMQNADNGFVMNFWQFEGTAQSDGEL
ncbi:MAG: hypothetical protein AB8G96_01480 [Phycisphaerales bacterium]